MAFIRGLLMISLLSPVSLIDAHQLVGLEVGCVAQVTVSDTGITGSYGVHFGEIVAFNERKRMDRNNDGKISEDEEHACLDEMCRKLPGGLTLIVDDKQCKVTLVGGSINLMNDRLAGPEPFEILLNIAPFSPINPSGRSATLIREPHRIAFRDINYAKNKRFSVVALETTGNLSILQRWDWKKRQFRNLFASSLREPVMMNVIVGPSTEVGKTVTVSEESRPPSGGIERLKEILKAPQLSTRFIIFAMVIALFLGAVHALEPGHGKTIVAAYLIGSRGTVLNAIFLGSVVTFTHTISVILLGLMTLFASQYVLPEQIFPWLGFVSGLCIVGVGIWMFVRAQRPHEHGHSHSLEGKHHHGDEEHGHEHPHEHHHDHGDEEHHEHHHDHNHDHNHPHAYPHEDEKHTHDHSHIPVHDHEGHHHDLPASASVSWGGLLSLGISGGLVPCPGALVILLTAVALHRIVFGLTLIVAFSLGLAAVLITIGILMVTTRSTFNRFTGSGRILQRLPTVSAVVITILGLILAMQALISGGIITVNLQ